MAQLAAKVRAADALVLATPVYYSDVSESLRAFLDRLRRTGTHPSGHKDLDGKRALGICVAGGGGGGAPTCCVSLERIMATSGFEVWDTIPVRRQNLESKLPALKQAGYDLVQQAV
ncbi:MAG: hypothetical protein A2269_06980 [Lentisphaerae bacterium RIFOXYA12_FULL_60_10]|nr:MAG: hypothetical protein A2269_06980 [Lentisphaerae bacterium RIFOXYA12_FULL_60_10]